MKPFHWHDFRNKHWLYLTVKETFKILLYSPFFPKACHFFLMHLLNPKAIGNIQSCLWKLICMEEKLKVMATSALPVTLELSTEMKETNCFFWIKDQCHKLGQLRVFVFPHKSKMVWKWNGHEWASSLQGYHDGAPSILSRTLGIHLY